VTRLSEREEAMWTTLCGRIFSWKVLCSAMSIIMMQTVFMGGK
jgi:hypothetical protein